MIITYYKKLKNSHNFKIVDFKTLKIQNMFQIFKFSKVFYQIYMGSYNVHDVLNKVIIYNTWNWTLK
jgi:hypothetical protein